jgi:class 3 adenylate cyclase/pimeloyl-ACP methyl ester carboxylesterase
MELPETHYAKRPDGFSVAYQVFGDGPRDIVFCHYFPGIDFYWDQPSAQRVMRRLAEMGRVICWDYSGYGASDHVSADSLPMPEGWMDEMRIVLDAVGSTRASFIGHAQGGFAGIVFAATYPERMEALVLVDGYAHLLRADDYPHGITTEMRDAIVAIADERLGTGGVIGAALVPTRARDESFRRWFARWERSAFTPATMSAAARWSMALDLRSVLPAINVPTLLIAHRGRGVNTSKYLADHIRGARLSVVPGPDVYLFSEIADDVIDEIEEFITGAPPVREPDRALATVLFTDIVSSTDHLSAVGDRRWRTILDEHDELVQRELERHRGRKVNTTGDGMLATFDGPARAVRCAVAIVDALAELGLEARAGIHAGEVELRGADIGGIAVHIGQRVCALARPREVLVSRTVSDLVAGSGLVFGDGGEHELKGVPGRWQVYSVQR